MSLYDLDLEAVDLEFRQQENKRLNFLQKSRAIPTPIDIYAIWIELYAQQGGKIRLRDRNYSKTAHVDANKNTYYVDDEANTPIAYENIGWSDWCPTQDGGQIPENYGSSSMTLLILPEVTGQDLYPATYDRREGWEWGHTTVLSIVRDKNSKSGFRAETNNPHGISTYKDVEALRKNMNLEQMLAKYNMRKGTKGLPAAPTGLFLNKSNVSETPELSVIKGKPVREKKSIGKMLRWLIEA